MDKSEPLNPELEKELHDKMDEYLRASGAIAEAFEQNRQANDAAADTFWNSLSYEDKCNAFHAVVSKIFEGEIKVQGSYRYVLYDIFKFGPDMYTRGMDCGYMALHNSIMDDEQFAKANAWMCDTLPKDEE
jgi:hypothetical protein